MSQRVGGIFYGYKSSDSEIRLPLKANPILDTSDVGLSQPAVRWLCRKKSKVGGVVQMKVTDWKRTV